MCVIYIAFNGHPDHPLIVLANRDEYYERPTLAAGYWDDSPNVFGGRDLIGGGTWLAVSKNGRFGAVTNYRDPNSPMGTISRGALVSEFLRSNESPAKYLENVMTEAKSYSGFNLIVGEISGRARQLFYCSNRSDAIVELEAGVFGLSNHLLNTPWPKVARGKRILQDLLSQGEVNDDRFFSILADESLADDCDLPATGIAYEAEKALSAIFIKTPGYGTRCSTVLKFDNYLRWTFEERVFV